MTFRLTENCCSVVVDGKPIKLLDISSTPPKQEDEIPVTNTSGKFTLNLVSMLDGKKISLRVRSKAGEPFVETQETDIARTGDIYDWGRVRSYFTAGVIFSKERDEFSQQDLAIGFNLDKNWWQRDLQTDKRRGPRWLSPFTHFNTFFEARLGSAPVVTATPTPTPPSTTSPTPTPTPAAATGCKDNTSVDCFVASRKVATMQIGGYAPIIANWMRWDFDGQENAIFIAPLAKTGIQTITSKEVEQNQILRGDDVFHFFGFGARLGHYKLSNRDRSPELISYLDIMKGKWENFDLFSPVLDKDRKPVLNEDKTPAMLRRRDWRLGFEGRLKIPQTPLFVGFDANLGKGPDDLRFIFGTRFDIGKIFGSLKSLQGLTPSP